MYTLNALKIHIVVVKRNQHHISLCFENLGIKDPTKIIYGVPTIDNTIDILYFTLICCDLRLR